MNSGHLRRFEFFSCTGRELTVEFAGQKKTAKADAASKWLVKLDAMSVSAEQLVLKANGTSISDVLDGMRPLAKVFRFPEGHISPGLSFDGGLALVSAQVKVRRTRSDQA